MRTLALAAAVAALLVAPLPAHAAQQVGDHSIIGHRGYARAHTENSLRALAAAADTGATSVETDVRLTRDEKFAVMHDKTLKRTTRCKGWTHRATKRRARRCRLDNGERVPMLTHYLAEAQRLGINVVIELKQDPARRWDAGHLATMRDLIARRGMADRVTFLSFSADLLALAENAAPHLPTVWIATTWPGVDQAAANGDAVAIHARDLDESRAAELAAAGMPVFGRNSNDPDVWAAYDAYGVTRVLTDDVPEYARWRS